MSTVSCQYFPIKLARSLQVWKPLLLVLETGKNNVELLQKNIVFPQNDFLAKDQITESLLEKQTALLYKLVEQNHERNDQQHPISHHKWN